MGSLRDIRKRVRSVKNTQKITKAMKLVAAAKLRRAQENIQAARPYAVELGAMLKRVATQTDEHGNTVSHPLLEVHQPRHLAIMVLTSDRGLCGSFNAGILRKAEAVITDARQKYEKVSVITVGRRAADYFKKQDIETLYDFPGVFNDLTFRRATEIAQTLDQRYEAEDLDAVFLLYNEFKSAISQEVVVEPLLPIVREDLPEDSDNLKYLYEPGEPEVLQKLVPRYLATGVWRALLESNASEHGARMSAMDNATKNAKELVEDLTLQYNRARQSAITGELMDIVGGVEALQG